MENREDTESEGEDEEEDEGEEEGEDHCHHIADSNVNPRQ